MRKGFTLIELAVSVALLVVVLLIASLIFRVSIESHRIATANAEIMQKLRAITQQLDTDFAGLRKDGEIAIAWTARKTDPNSRTDPDRDDPDGYVRMDRIMFFCDGDFQAYGTYSEPDHLTVPVRGNLARVCYQLARDADDVKPNDIQPPPPKKPQERNKRMLARTQHILTAQNNVDAFPDVDALADNNTLWKRWNRLYEYDAISLDTWTYIPAAAKMDMLTAIMDVTVGSSAIDETLRGARIDKRDADTLHMLLCEGVGEFSVQGWSDYLGRWFPDVDPDDNGSTTDSDFFLTEEEASDPNIPGLLYPYREFPPPDPNYGSLRMRAASGSHVDRWMNNPEWIRETYFNNIPGLGRALKFTFTLYDSKGVLPKGRTFTHIVYLGD